MRFARWLRELSARPEDAGRHLLRAAARAANRRVASVSDAEDVAQEAAARVLRCASRTPPHTRFEAWVAGVVKHVVLERLRLQRRAPPRLLPTRVADPRTAADNVEAWAALREEARELKRIVDLLPPPDRQIAAMLLGGATYAKIADFLCQWRGVGTEEARRLTRATLRRIREAWGEDPTKLFADRFGEKNPWTHTPPPPASVIRAWDKSGRPSH